MARKWGIVRRVAEGLGIKSSPAVLPGEPVIVSFGQLGLWHDPGERGWTLTSSRWIRRACRCSRRLSALINRYLGMCWLFIFFLSACGRNATRPTPSAHWGSPNPGAATLTTPRRPRRTSSSSVISPRRIWATLEEGGDTDAHTPRSYVRPCWQAALRRDYYASRERASAPTSHRRTQRRLASSRAQPQTLQSLRTRTHANPPESHPNP